MKTRFNSLDLAFELKELRKEVVGLRVQQIYDIDSKTYLVKLQKPDDKKVLLIESGARIHTTRYVVITVMRHPV